MPSLAITAVSAIAWLTTAVFASAFVGYMYGATQTASGDTYTLVLERDERDLAAFAGRGAETAATPIIAGDANDQEGASMTTHISAQHVAVPNGSLESADDSLALELIRSELDKKDLLITQLREALSPSSNAASDDKESTPAGHHMPQRAMMAILVSTSEEVHALRTVLHLDEHQTDDFLAAYVKRIRNEADLFSGFASEARENGKTRTELLGRLQVERQEFESTIRDICSEAQFSRYRDFQQGKAKTRSELVARLLVSEVESFLSDVDSHQRELLTRVYREFASKHLGLMALPGDLIGTPTVVHESALEELDREIALVLSRGQMDRYRLFKDQGTGYLAAIYWAPRSSR